MRPLTTILSLLLLALAPMTPAIASDVRLPLGVVTASPTPEPGGLSVRLLDIPANTKDDPRTRAYIVDRLAPGTEIRRRIQVENNTGAPQSVRLYPGAAHIQDGTFIGDAAETKNELTSWITLEQQQLNNLAPGSSADVLTTIRVPNDAPEGEQYGAIWAEMRSTTDETSKGGITQVNRVGIRIYLSVGPGNGKPADFSIASLTAVRDSEGKPQLSATVTNTGGRALDILGDLTLNGGPGGLSAGPFSVQKASTIAPGKAQNVVFSLPVEIPNGPWNAKVQLRSGLLEHEATAPVTFPDNGSMTPPAAVQEQDTALPFIMGVALAATLALAIAAVLIRRHRRRRLPTD